MKNRNRSSPRKQALSRKEQALSVQNEELKFALEALEISTVELEAQNRELIESREALNESNDRYRDLYDFAPIGYMTLSKAGIIKDLNLTAAILLGVERNRLVGHTFIHLVSMKDRKSFGDHLTEEAKHTPVEILLRKTNAPVQLDSVWSRDSASGETVIRMAISDLTDKKQAEREKSEIARKYQEELEKQKSQAERANLTKSAFLANMSHEIRTPLAAILGFTELLQRAHSEAKRSYFGTVISKNGKILTKLIDDILDLSKVEAGRLQLEKIDFNVETLIEEVFSLFKEAARKKNINISTRLEPLASPWVNSDPTRIRQILLNLIGNAIKFTSEGEIEVEMKPRYENGKMARLEFSVKDSGIGMSPSQMKMIFEPFSQADNTTTRNFGGTGLGLILSRRMARALGGDVQIAESQLGKGSKFVASVCVKSANPNAELAKSENAILRDKGRRSPRRKGLKVLLVEDSRDNQDLVSLILEEEGMIVDVAENGAIGIEMAEGNNYDVVLMDMQMPVVDGYEATARLRHDGYIKPIVALTAHAMVEDKIRILSLGCDAHLTKPLDSSLLIETVSRFGA